METIVRITRIIALVKKYYKNNFNKIYIIVDILPISASLESIDTYKILNKNINPLESIDTYKILNKNINPLEPIDTYKILNKILIQWSLLTRTKF